MKEKSESRPNVLLVVADQHHAGMMGCAGHPQALTPNMDAFAASGTRFSSAYCQNPICTPSRVSFLSAQYPHNNGYYGLSGPANPGLDNLFRHFKRHGYRTAAYGKLHLPESPRNWIADDVDEFGDAYETADGLHGHSEFLDGLERDGLRDLEDSWHNTRHYGSRSLSLDATVSDLPYERTMERWAADKAMRFMDACGQDTPFCIEVAFQRPHHPLLPQKQFWNLYPENLDLPPDFNQPPDGRPPHFQQAWHDIRSHQWDFARPGDGPLDGMRRAWRGTLACVSQMDDVFGRLLRFLDERGLAENTIVIYTSDHGCYHTQKGLPEKAPGICSEDVCRVPLLWRAPGITRPGTVSPQLIELVDLAPTLSSLCGLPEMDGADGLDATPLLRGEATPLHDCAVTSNVWSKAIRWGKWRLVHYPRKFFAGDATVYHDPKATGGPDVGELYDMEADPGETRNLYHDPDHQAVVSEGRRLLLDWITSTLRSVTSMPAVVESERPASPEAPPPGFVGHRTYPLASDGRAPASVQPRRRKDLAIAYA